MALISILISLSVAVKIFEGEKLSFYFEGKIDKKNFKGELNISKSKKYPVLNGKIYQKKYVYEGSFKIISNGKLAVIQELPMEEYIKGVVPMEIPYSWPAEVLKAQAVIARTYAYKNLNKHINEGYNLCSTVHCQVYGGKADYPEVIKAVQDTKGIIVVYKNEIANTYYHSNCGGKTEDVKDIWGGEFEYLKGVTCFKKHNSRDDTWTAAYKKSELSKIFGKNIYEIRASKKSGTGRIIEYEIKTDGGVIYEKGALMRLKLNPFKLRSNMIDKIETTPTHIIFTGRGWGHGVGLCQDGARKLATEGYSYKEIIRFYYPGVKFKKMDD